ncbi:MAG TPA: hypothetical protein VKF82_04045 [Candidatus Eremiobacteraceae bacterium]|nr:hypothetical protein [Candidatus Eremiobacteraceae bacterium]
MSKFRHAAVGVLSLVAVSISPVLADNASLQAKLAQIKASISANQQRLAQYTWQQTETISVRGDVKDQEQYQVQIGPDGKPQKSLESAPPPAGRPHGIKHHIEQNYADYAKQIGALAQSYAQPDPGKLQSLYQQGQVVLGSGGAANTVSLIIHNYVKSGDSVTLVFNRAQEAIVSLNVSTYLSGPSDGVTIAAAFGQLGDGTNYVANLTVNGSSKSLTVQDVNSNFQKR